MNLEKKILWLLKTSGLVYLIVNIPLFIYFNYQKIIEGNVFDFIINFTLLSLCFLVLFFLEKIFTVLKLNNYLYFLEKNKIIKNNPKSIFRLIIIITSLIIGFFQIRILIGLVTTTSLDKIPYYPAYYYSSIITLTINLFSILYNFKISNLLFKYE